MGTRLPRTLHDVVQLVLRLLRWSVVGIGTMVLVQIPVSNGLAPFAGAFAASAVGYVVSGQVNFAWNSWWTWRDRHPTMAGISKRWAKFCAVNITAAVINALALTLLGSIGSQFVRTLLANFVSSVFNFTAYHFVVFRGEQAPSGPDSVLDVEEDN